MGLNTTLKAYSRVAVCLLADNVRHIGESYDTRNTHPLQPVMVGQQHDPKSATMAHMIPIVVGTKQVTCMERVTWLVMMV